MNSLGTAALASAALCSVADSALGQSTGARVARDFDSSDSSNGAPTLYFSQNVACTIAPNCAIPASSVFPNPNDYTTLATLALPEGDYLLSSKLGAIPMNAIVGGTNFGYFNFECALVDIASNAPLDYSSFDGLFRDGVVLQAPVSFHKRTGGNVRVGCRVYGFGGDGSPIDVRVWNVNISAIAVDVVKPHTH